MSAIREDTFQGLGTALRTEPAFLTRIRLRAQRRVLWLRQLWAHEGASAGFAISHEEVDRILSEPGELWRAELAFYDTQPAARALDARVRAADAAAALDPHVARVRSAFGLSEPELDLLTLAAAIEVDPWYRRVLGYLHDDATSTAATPWLAAELFHWPAETRIGPDSSLIRWRLARPVEPQPSPSGKTAAWVVDPAIVACLAHGVLLDPRLNAATRLVQPSEVEASWCLYPAALREVVSFVRTLESNASTTELVLVGPHGAGKRTLATQACRELGVPLLIADASKLLAPGVEPAAAQEAATLVARSARLLDAAVHWHDAGAAQPGAFRDTAGYVPLAFLDTDGNVPQGAELGSNRRTLRLPQLTRAERAVLWSKLSSAPVPATVLDWPLLPLDLARAAALVPAGPEAVEEACRTTRSLDASGLAARLPLPYDWKDLVLPRQARQHLDEVEQQARLRWPVYEEWGFGRLCPLGRGITTLFAGPSGTGKTMAAQVLARSLGIELYRIDLAAVMSKYIGDTEKRLRDLFDAAERCNVLLFFDEADALFGKRTEVQDAHDRFANIEIDYLLQRMEQFDGIAVLATNRRSDLDSAFTRRIRFFVDFQLPGPKERRELWTLALHERAPDGTELLGSIAWDLLAERLELTGAEIKTAALGAAFLARAEGNLITMTHVVSSARRELAKRGVVLRADALEGKS